MSERATSDGRRATCERRASERQTGVMPFPDDQTHGDVYGKQMRVYDTQRYVQLP